MPSRVLFRRIGIGLLLCLALGVTIVSGVQVAQAIGRLRLSHRLAQSGDVHTIRPWMTLHYVSRVYHVPESYLLQSLDISNAQSVRHVTLYALAQRLHLSTGALIQKIQTAILTYRQQHSATPQSGAPHSAIPPPLGRGMAA